jgi:uncharacterized membrane protein SpoIIM required for sporulation
MDTKLDDSFQQLELMLDKIDRSGLSSLNNEELLLLGHLYRRAVTALSEARRLGVQDSRIEYLNRLSARAYGHIYHSESKGWPSVPNFFKNEFPQTFRRNLPFIAAAFLISMIAGLFAYSQVRSNPAKADLVLGPTASSSMDWITERHTGHQNWMPEEQRPMMASFIMSNNIRVTILAFSTGILLGIGTLFLLFYNGLMLGVVAAAVSNVGGDVPLGFWSFVAPHGVIELTAIFIAGGAGLMLGWALLNPGERSRRDALKLAGREALKLMLGVAAMLVVAGTIEGFFSPSMVPDHLKLAVAAVLGLAEYTYLFMAGRDKKQMTDNG